MWALGAAVVVSLLLGVGAAGAVDEIRTTIQKAGTATVGDGPRRTISVEAVYDEAVTAPPTAWRRALTGVRFRDGAGGLLYQETFETRMVAGQGFDEETAVTRVLELRGTRRRFVLVVLGFEPSAASGGTALAIFGFDAKGRFRRLARSLSEPGTRIANAVDGAAGVVRLREGRYLDVAEWTSHFTLVLPWQFDEQREEWELAKLCGRVEVRDRQPARRSTVELHRPRPGTEDLRTLARYKTIAVRPDSKIEFLEGCRRYTDTPTGATYTPWLHVRIDGEDGWVVNDALDGLGLPAAD